jgi:hypothetical protein
MTSRTPEFDQSDRTAHPWSIAEPGSWSELGESVAFVGRAAGLALHPVTLALAALAALAASWALPLTFGQLLPWLGDAGAWATIWAWCRLGWLVLAVCLAGTVIARAVSARPTGAQVWGALPSMLASCGLCVSTYLATLLGLMLAAWLAAAVGTWMGGPFGAGLATLIGAVAALAAVVASLLLLLAIPAIAANDADAPDAIQRAAAHLIARPGLSAALLALGLLAVVAVVWLASVGVLGVRDAMWIDPEAPAPAIAWLAHTIGLLLAAALGWTAMTQCVLTLREVVDREDRATCWDPRPQSEAVRQAIEARAVVAGRSSADPVGGPAPTPTDERAAAHQD